MGIDSNESVFDASDLLSHLELPSLISLNLFNYHTDRLPSPAHLPIWIKSLLRAPSCQLRILALWFWRMNVKELTDFFSSPEMRGLTQLDVIFGTTPHGIIKLLTHRQGGKQSVLPNLVELTLPNVERYDGVIEMIELRLPTLQTVKIITCKPDNVPRNFKVALEILSLAERACYSMLYGENVIHPERFRSWVMH
ncbi:hypothetical protein Hypma_010799 [Hypsizygus marmoreus]|uniref:F-box domain-containing protein n=1 Tax=Hypsizygus marmoreus TaxID=39966 RepID=A0A369JHR3_HYPMA|nr:hypothetical protein Hypma_010799 [Hypsizygus marmoreus]